MFLILQITFTILAALCVAAVVPVGALVDWGWGAFFAFVAILFFVFMKICKTQVQIDEAKKKNTPPAQEQSQTPEKKDEKR